VRKATIFLALLALLLVISGCDINIVGVGNRGKAEIPEVYAGTEALTMRFMENAPPDKVVSGSDISISLLIKNRGATNIAKTRGVVRLTLNDAYLTLSNNEAAVKNFAELEDKETKALFGRETQSSGGSDLMKFNIKVNDLTKEDYKENPKTTVLATVCYPYKTVLATPVCIDQNPYSASSKACEMKDISLSGGQGAPVAVTRIEQSFAFRNERLIPQFKIFVGNVGNGEVVNLSDVEKACSAAEAKYNVVKLDSAELLEKGLRCDKTELSLDDIEKNYFLCSYQEGFVEKDQSFYTELKAEFSYGYIIKNSRSIEIEVVEMPGSKTLSNEETPQGETAEGEGNVK
jgi:hypothetical protein